MSKIADIENLKLAYKNTSKNKKSTFGYLEFREYDQYNLIQIQKELLDGTYKVGEYRKFVIYEPKAREISALNFKDRLVQHALCNIISPIFDKTLLPYTFACRRGMGTHGALDNVRETLKYNNFKYFLKTDFSKYFASIDHDVLWPMIEKRIHCRDTIKLIEEIIPRGQIGIPIGSLTSQLMANVYASQLDHYIHHELKQRYWTRYMDDIVILGDDRQELLYVFRKIEEFSKNSLNLKISKWQVSPLSNGINFVGYRIWKAYTLVRKDCIKKAKGKIPMINTISDLDKFLASWYGHTKWANCNHITEKLRKALCNRLIHAKTSMRSSAPLTMTNSWHF
jgi:RNA-directed DNA polymerase